MNICITGKLLSGLKKHNYEEPLAACGHQLVDIVNADLDILVVSDLSGNPSSKTKKAIALGITIMSEDELQELIEEG